MKTGWLKDGSWYYLDETGVMRTGWKQVDGNWYYLNDFRCHANWLETYKW